MVLTFDEMKIKEGLVYNKYTDSLVGFVHLDDVGSHRLSISVKQSISLKGVV